MRRAIKMSSGQAPAGPEIWPIPALNRSNLSPRTSPSFVAGARRAEDFSRMPKVSEALACRVRPLANQSCIASGKRGDLVCRLLEEWGWALGIITIDTHSTGLLASKTHPHRRCVAGVQP
jgi:hypothetical protein